MEFNSTVGGIKPPVHAEPVQRPSVGVYPGHQYPETPLSCPDVSDLWPEGVSPVTPVLLSSMPAPDVEDPDCFSPALPCFFR
jgi:hypothetical protein